MIIPPHCDLDQIGAENNYEWKQYLIRDSEESLPSCPFKQSIIK
ncbi:YqcI/YcgG family protein [Paenibacillus lemnae]